MIRDFMGILVTFSMPQGFRIPVGILQMRRYGGDALLFNQLEGFEICPGRIRFGCSRQNKVASTIG